MSSCPSYELWFVDTWGKVGRVKVLATEIPNVWWVIGHSIRARLGEQLFLHEEDAVRTARKTILVQQWQIEALLRENTNHFRGLYRWIAGPPGPVRICLDCDHLVSSRFQKRHQQSACARYKMTDSHLRQCVKEKKIPAQLARHPDVRRFLQGSKRGDLQYAKDQIGEEIAKLVKQARELEMEIAAQ